MEQRQPPAAMGSSCEHLLTPEGRLLRVPSRSGRRWSCPSSPGVCPSQVTTSTGKAPWGHTGGKRVPSAGEGGVCRERSPPGRRTGTRARWRESGDGGRHEAPSKWPPAQSQQCIHVRTETCPGERARERRDPAVINTRDRHWAWE